jgi:hypothetical protein
VQFFYYISNPKKESTVSNLVISRYKKIFVGIAVAVSAITALPAIAGTIVAGTLV